MLHVKDNLLDFLLQANKNSEWNVNVSRLKPFTLTITKKGTHIEKGLLTLSTKMDLALFILTSYPKGKPLCEP